MSTAINLSSQLAVDVRGIEGLRMKAASGDPAALKAAARQFEAMLVQTMLKSARGSSLAGTNDAFGGSSDMKFYKELLDQQWAQSIVAGKGLGLADMLMKRFEQDAGTAALKAEPASKALPEKAGSASTSLPAAVLPEQGAARMPVQRQAEDAVLDSGQGRDSGKGHHDDRKQRFIDAMLPHARAAEQVTGVPARFVLAHAALESGWGKHEIISADGVRSHNLFGIKADSGWAGQAMNVVTTEYKQGLAMKISAKFRAYGDYAQSFIDYARLLKRRYQSAVAAGDDALQFTRSLAGGGYATDPAYATKLLGTIHSVTRAGV